MSINDIQSVLDNYYQLISELMDQPNEDLRRLILKKVDLVHEKIKEHAINEVVPHKDYKFMNLIKDYDGNRLSNYFGRLNERILDKKLSPDQKVEGRKRLELIKLEWIRRREEGQIFHRPERGLLASMKYHVGEAKGLKKEPRRRILLELLRGPIPYIGGPDYMEEWGDDGSTKRFKKLTKVITRLLLKAENNDWEKARKEWSEDLEWLNDCFVKKLSFTQEEMIQYINKLILHHFDK